MGTRGYIVYVYKGIYYVLYNHWDSYPEGLGEKIVNEISEFDDEPLKIILNKLKITDNENILDISTSRPVNDLFIEWIYFINFDKNVFEVEGGVVDLSYKLNKIPEDWMKPLEEREIGGNEIDESSEAKFKYAVVNWYNYRKELSAGFMKGFNNLDDAKKFAYKQAEKDREEYDNEGDVITEDQIDDNNGPGKYGSPYANYTIVGYGGRNSDGYATTFYSVVDWFDGVENDWDSFEDDDYWEEKYGDSWYPKYEC